MQGTCKSTVAVVIALSLCIAVTVFAQKGKPAPAPTYTWEATLPPVTSEFDIYGPDAYTFKSTLGARVGASYYPPNSTWPGESVFQLSLVNQDASNGGFIGFRDVGWASSSGPTPLCLYPKFNEETGWVLSGLAGGGPRCLVDYLSGFGPVGHKHPNDGVSASIGIELRVQNIDFNQMSPGESRSFGAGALTFTSYREVQCLTGDNPYSGVAGLFKTFKAGTVVVTRSAIDDQWVVSFSLPASIAEWIPSGVTTKRGGCEPPQMGMVSETGTVSGELTFTRR